MNLPALQMHSRYLCDWSNPDSREPPATQAPQGKPAGRDRTVHGAAGNTTLPDSPEPDMFEIWSLRLYEMHARQQLAEVFAAV